jgi:hypothetical protein
MKNPLPALDHDREQFPYSVPMINASHTVNEWCRDTIGEENEAWCCRKPRSQWASVVFLFRNRNHWELFLKHWG